MHFKISGVVIIQRPPADAFAGLLDFSKWPQWQGGLESVERVSADPLQVGSQVRQIRKGGKPSESMMEVTHLVPNQLLGMRDSSRPLSWQDTFTLKPVDTNTQLALQFDIDSSGLLGLIAYLIIKLTLKQELLKFKALVEAS